MSKSMPVFYFISCLIVFFVSADLTSCILVSYYAVNGLGAELFQSNWMLTSYLVASAIGVISSSWLNHRLDLRRSILLSLLGISVFHLFCFLTESYVHLVLLRGLVGFFSSIVFITVNDIALAQFPIELKKKVDHMWACLITIGMFFGLNLGAFIAEVFFYKAIFVIMSVIFLLLIAGCECTLVSNLRLKCKREFNGLSFCLLALFFIPIQLFLDLGYQLSWFQSPFFCLLLPL